MRLFKIILGLMLLVSVFACRRQAGDNTTQPYYTLDDTEKTLQTRAEKCQQIPGKKFDNNTEECKDLNLAGQNASDAKLACPSLRFHKWDDEKGICVVDPQLVDEYQKNVCAPKGKVYIDGACVPPQ